MYSTPSEFNSSIQKHDMIAKTTVTLKKFPGAVTEWSKDAAEKHFKSFTTKN